MYEGYESVSHRKELQSFTSKEDYLADQQKKMGHQGIDKYEITGTEDVEAPIKEILTVTIEGFNDLNSNTLLINPFFMVK